MQNHESRESSSCFPCSCFCSFCIVVFCTALFLWCSSTAATIVEVFHLLSSFICTLVKCGTCTIDQFVLVLPQLGLMLKICPHMSNHQLCSDVWNLSVRKFEITCVRTLICSCRETSASPEFKFLQQAHNGELRAQVLRVSISSVSVTAWLTYLYRGLLTLNNNNNCLFVY